MPDYNPNSLIKFLRQQLTQTANLIKLNGISPARYSLLAGRIDAYTQLINWLKGNSGVERGGRERKLGGRRGKNIK
jgi:hypothetical protein